MVNLHPLTPHITPSYSHKMANVSWSQMLWCHFTLCITRETDRWRVRRRGRPLRWIATSCAAVGPGDVRRWRRRRGGPRRRAVAVGAPPWPTPRRGATTPTLPHHIQRCSEQQPTRIHRVSLWSRYDRHFVGIHWVKWRHRIYGHDTIAIF